MSWTHTGNVTSGKFCRAELGQCKRTLMARDQGDGTLTLGSDGIGHGTWIAQALAVDRSHHEQVDGVGTETLHGKLGGFDMICYRLPAVAH